MNIPTNEDLSPVLPPISFECKIFLLLNKEYRAMLFFMSRSRISFFSERQILIY